MTSRLAFALALSFLVAVSFAASEWDPVKGVKDIDAVERALRSLVISPHLSAAQRASSKRVVDDVHSIVAELESGKVMSKKVKAEKVSAAIKELQKLQEEWQRVLQDAKSRSEASDQQVAALEKKLAEKKALLAKDEKMFKLYTMEKELAEKKLELQSLEDKKAQAHSKAEEDDERQQGTIVAKLSEMAKSMAAAKSNGNASVISTSKTLEAIVADLRSRATKLSASLRELDMGEKKREAEIASIAEKKFPGEKGRSMRNYVLKKERRTYKKERAAKQAELAEISKALGSIEAGNVKALQDTLSKMGSEFKALQAKTKNFLY